MTVPKLVRISLGWKEGRFFFRLADSAQYTSAAAFLSGSAVFVVYTQTKMMPNALSRATSPKVALLIVFAASKGTRNEAGNYDQRKGKWPRIHRQFYSTRFGFYKKQRRLNKPAQHVS